MMINNLFKFFSYLFYFSFGFMTFLIIRIISPIKVIRFSFINSHRFGHFALEGISGKGKTSLIEAIKEAKIFMQSKSIESTKTTWIDLHKTMQKNS